VSNKLGGSTSGEVSEVGLVAEVLSGAYLGVGVISVSRYHSA
jgi:hypothetical protein